MFDEVIVVIAVNSKKNALFEDSERLEMASASLEHIENVEVIIRKGLTVDIAREKGATAIIRGVRAVSDFDYEFQIALMNRKLNPDAHTVFLMPHENYTYLNSTIIRELSSYDVDVSEFVPEVVSEYLKKKFGGGKK